MIAPAVVMLLEKLWAKQLKNAGRMLGRITSFSTAIRPPPRSRAERSSVWGTWVSAAEQSFVVVGSCLKSIQAMTIRAVPVSFRGSLLNARI